MKKLSIIITSGFISLAAFSQAYNQSGLFYNTDKTYIKLLENPVRGQINIEISNSLNQKYDLGLYSLNGQKVAELTFTHSAGVSTKTLYVSNGLSGMYFLVARTPEGQQSLKVFIQ